MLGPRIWPVRFHIPPAVYNMATTSHGRCHGLPKTVIIYIFRQRFIKAENARCFYFSILEAGTQFTGPEGRCTVGFQKKVSSPCERKREEMPPFTPCMFPTAAITNEHTLVVSNKTNVFSHSDGERKSITQHCIKARFSTAISLQGRQGSIYFLPLSALGDVGISWFMAASLPVSASVCTFLILPWNFSKLTNFKNIQQLNPNLKNFFSLHMFPHLIFKHWVQWYLNNIPLPLILSQNTRQDRN